MALFRKPSGDAGAAPLSREVTVVNKLGMHARPAAMFVKTASKFESTLDVEKDGEQINGKSIMGLMMLAAGQGAKLTLTARGRDAAAALNELEQLFVRKFDEE
ncbi:HPr family phosphocarrier protein [bacterium]|nr:HPr family phosphocarrier protein [bacterium]